MPEWLGEYKGHRLGREPGRPSIYRYWRDEKAGRWLRRSLRTDDQSIAMRTLIDVVERGHVTAEAREAVSLAQVFAHYLSGRWWPHRSGGKPSRDEAQRAKVFADVLAFAKAHVGRDDVMLADYDILVQRSVIREWAARGVSVRVMRIYHSYVSTAVRWAARPQISRLMDGSEAIVHLITEAPYVETREAAIGTWCDRADTRRQKRLISLDDMARLVEAAAATDDGLFRWMVIALTTAARPSAIMDINFFRQVDWRFDLLDINPVGRIQNRKRRPVIGLSSILAGWVRHWNEAHPVPENRQSSRNLYNAVQRAAAAAGIGPVGTYGFRHFVSQQMRQRGVPREVRSAWLGHMDSEGSRTSAHYEHETRELFEPAVEAIDAMMLDINQRMQKETVFPPETIEHLKIVEA